MGTVTFSSDNQVIGASGATLTVTFTNTNSLDKDGKIVIDFPWWNHKAGMDTHFIDTESPTCTDGSNMIISSCAYSNADKQLTVNLNLVTDSPASTSHTFEVSGFRNPYSGAQRNGFTVSAYDSDSCQIEQTTTSPTITVTEFATISSATLSRFDS